VRDVVPEPDGAVWIGTYGGGVGRLRAGRVARLTVEQGLPDNSVSRMLDDGRGRLWISTNRGLAVVRASELEAAADGRDRVMEVVVLGAERGVPEANFGSPAGFAEEGGRLWFGTIAGAVSVDAAAFPFNAWPPAVRIEEVRADDRALPLGPTVRVPPLTGRLRLGFAGSVPLYPELMRFRFRVEGTDADWVDAGAGRTVDWSPPGPGRHRFLVEARNEDGIWSSAPAAVVLDVLPAWWQTTAFRLAGSLAGALLGLAVVWQVVRRVEQRHAEQVRVLEEQRQAEEKVASLRAQLEHVSRAALAGELATSLAHEVRQPLGAIVNNAEALRRNLARYLQRPAELEQVLGDIVADAMRASEVVQGLRGFLGSAGPEATAVDLSALVREMLPLVRRELQDNRVAVELDLAEGLPPVEGLRVQLGQVVVNLQVNASEALAGVGGERRLAIRTAERDGSVELAVTDSGPGPGAEVAARLFEPFVTTKPEGLGVGLAICRSIAERHGGRLSADAPPGSGFRMTLTLPSVRPPEPRP
jgi:signal transduction histidine kinase